MLLKSIECTLTLTGNYTFQKHSHYTFQKHSHYTFQKHSHYTFVFPVITRAACLECSSLSPGVCNRNRQVVRQRERASDVCRLQAKHLNLEPGAWSLEAPWLQLLELLELLEHAQACRCGRNSPPPPPCLPPFRDERLPSVCRASAAPGESHRDIIRPQLTSPRPASPRHARKNCGGEHGS